MLASVALASSGCQSDQNRPYTDRKALESYMRQAPGVPTVLPTTLPEQYEFLGPGFEQSRDNRVVVRTMEFRLEEGASSGVVDVCIAEQASPAEVCVPPGAESNTIRRDMGAYPVWIRPLGSAAMPVESRTFWTTIPLTSDLDQVGWLG